MLGTTTTQQTFASSNSIAIVPQISAEWNYNAFVQPYVVTSTSVSQILAAGFNSTASMTPIFNASVAATASGVGITNLADPTASALSFTIASKVKKNYTTASAATGTSAQIISSSVSLSSPAKEGLFYKFIFYVKTGGVNYTDTIPPTILATGNVSAGVGTTSSYYYRVVGVGSDGQTLGPDILNNTDLLTLTTNGTSSAILNLSWTKSDKASVYRIYRSVNDNTATSYITTTASGSYVDTASNSIIEAYSPGYFNSHIKVTPRVIVNSDSTNKIVTEVATYVMATNNVTGRLEKSTTSVEATIDQWKRVEVWFGAPTNSNIQISSVKLAFDMFSEYEGAVLLVDNIQLYQITEHDFYLNDYYPTDSVFTQFRPGESLLNPSILTADTKVNKYTSSSISRPVTFGLKSPQVYIAKEFMSPQTQILPSIYDKFKYYISDQKNKAIQAQYPQYLSVNKIVLKYSQRFSSINSGSIILYGGPNSTASVLPLGSASFNNSGLTTLYFNGTSWTTTAWSSPPALTASGTLQNVVNQVRGISFIAGTTTTKSEFSSTNFSGDDNKIHIVELSPRLELDLSSILISYNLNKELTSPNSQGFPLSYINSNSGALEFSNIPIYQTSGFGATILENQAKNATFYGLLRQGVKFTTLLKNTSFGSDLTETVPQFVMYSNTWNINDIGNVSVEMFDITKIFAQGTDSPQYAAHQSDLFTIISDMFAIYGFSDYDYDGLKIVCKTVTNTTDFWFDESKTLFENLQELLLPHQIGAFIDEYGIMRFRSLSQIFNEYNSASYVADFAVTDVSSSVGSINYIANIIPDSYSENVNEKIGKVLVRYKIPQNSDSADNNQNNVGVSQLYAKNSEAPAQVWQEDVPTGLPSFKLRESFRVSDNYIQFNVHEQFGGSARQSLSNFQGDFLVRNEIVGYSGIEYVFYPTNTAASFSNFALTKIVNSPSDITDGIKQVRESLSTYTIPSVEYNPTGKIVGIQRGKYGTKASDHFVAERPIVDSVFNFYTYSLGNAAATSVSGSVISGAGKTTGLFLTSAEKNVYNMIVPQSTASNGYNLFAMDFVAPIGSTSHKKPKPKNKHKKRGKYTDYDNLAVGLFFNLNGTTVSGTTASNSTHFVEIQSNQPNKNSSDIEYYLSLYRIENNAVVKPNIIVSGTTTSTKLASVPIDSVFDGRDHRLSVYVNQSSISVAIDSKRVLQRKVIMRNKAAFKFGAYVKPLEAKTAKIYINELYADTVEPPINSNSYPDIYQYDIESRYYFTTKEFMNKIISNGCNLNNIFLYQSFPQVRGFKLYDVKYALTPIIPDTANIYPIQYGVDAIASKKNDETEVLGPVIPNDLKYSDLFTTPFRTRFAVVNNTDEVVYLKSAGDTNATPLHIISKFQKLSEDQVVEYVIDPNHINNTIELETEWISSRAEAEKIVQLMAKAIPSFYTDINITIFGNPLVQVGDFAKFTYKLKRIGYDPADSSIKPLNCLVTSVQQGFQEGVAETRLVLKPLII